MTNFFRKRKLRVFSVAVFLIVLFLSQTDHVIGATSVGKLQRDAQGNYYFLNQFNNPVPLKPTAGQDPTKPPTTFFYSNGVSTVIYAVDQNNDLFSATPAQADKAAAQREATIGGCNFVLNFLTGNFWEATGCFLARVFYTILSLVALLLGLVGVLFNFVFKFTVVDIKQNTENIAAIAIGWRAVRDIANISFIFILLYLAIATILQLGEHGVKKSLSTLIIAAVLINFSLFFVKIIIDVPNILAIQIYNKAMSGVTSNTAGTTSGGLGDAFLTMFAPQAVFQDSSQNSAINLKNIGTANANNASWNFAKNPLSTFAMGIIIMTVAIAVFLAVCVILIKRFVMLIFYMIFSPLAFAGMAIPIHSLQGAAREKFWNGLIKEAFYAPIFMLCVYITLSVGYALNTNSAKFDIADITGAFQGVVGNIVSYSIVMVMLVASLFIAEMMGVKGAAGAMSVYNGVTGGARGFARFTGGGAWNNTIGRLAYGRLNVGDSAARLALQAKSNNLIKRYVARGQIAALKTAGKGFSNKIETEAEYKEAYEHEVHGDANKIAKGILESGGSSDTSAEMRSQIKLWDKKSTKDKAAVLVEMDQEIEKVNDAARKTALQKTRDYFSHRSSPNDREEIDRMIQQGTPSHKRMIVDDHGHPVANMQDIWKNKLNSSQRRTVMTNLTRTEAMGIGATNIEAMMNHMVETDTSAVETILRSDKSSDEAKKAASAAMVNAYIKFSEAQDKATVSQYKAAAELFEKNANRYTDIRSLPQPVQDNLARVEKEKKKNKDDREEFLAGTTGKVHAEYDQLIRTGQHTPQPLNRPNP